MFVESVPTPGSITDRGGIKYMRLGLCSGDGDQRHTNINKSLQFSK